MTDRRSFLLAASALALPGVAWAQQAQDAPPADQATPPAEPAADPRLAERIVGNPEVPRAVIEYFSLTCPHCAAFHKDTWPQVKRQLVDTGRIRMILRDFPLDQVALLAAMVARSLPAAQYDAFVSTLFATQDRWAFARGVDPRAELWKLASVAGMSRETYDTAIADQALARGILETRVKAQQEYNVNSTPTFVFGTRVVPGGMAYDRFAQIVGEMR
ncbi:DsbA family protein [Falsiroseomonas sp. HW251]|uniref:DsbA family protein n=1 Tax=Falsiroseomonas sp. HW251 TaxID=3390998 RepID=UPI003D320D44